MKRLVLSVLYLWVLFQISATFAGCKKETVIPEPEPQFPVDPIVYFWGITEISYTSALLKAQAASPSETTITSRGFCLGTSEILTINNNIIYFTADVDVNYTYKLTGLTRNTTYFVCAFAINSVDTTLTKSKSFTTLSGFPTVRTASIINDTPSIYIAGGDIQSEGLSAVLEYGVCLSLSHEPEKTGTKIPLGNGIGSFSTVLDDLSQGKTYFVKAYAINSLGTGYGVEVSFNYWNGILSDIEGNIYNTMLIGNQRWMTENLKTTKYKDGTVIPFVTQNSIWSDLSTPGFCWYNNSEENNKKLYGALYNWHSVNTGKICPEGWHVPSREEWVSFLEFLSRNGYMFPAGMNYFVAKAMAAKYGWATSSVSGTVGNDMENNNKSGFSALPAGFRNKDDGSFKSLGYNSTFWSSSEYTYPDLTTTPWNYEMSYNASNVTQKVSSKKNGYSVRCILDN